MRTIICQPKAVIGKFVSDVIGQGRHLPWENYSTLALVDETRILCGVVYNHFSASNVCMHVAAIPGSSWLTPSFLFAAFDYPFVQLKVRRVTGLVPGKNLEAQKFDENLGFSLEGIMKEALPDDDLLVYGMLKKECKWISPRFVSLLQRRSLRRTSIGELAVA